MIDKTIDFEEFYQKFRDNPPTFTGVPVTVLVPLPYLRELADLRTILIRIETALHVKPQTGSLASFEAANPQWKKQTVRKPGAMEE